MATTKAASGVFDAEILQDKDAKTEYSEYFDNGTWLREHWKQIRKRYPGHIVIIVDRDMNKVHAFEKTEEARKFIRALPAPNQAYVRYIPAANEALLL